MVRFVMMTFTVCTFHHTELCYHIISVGLKQKRLFVIYMYKVKKKKICLQYMNQRTLKLKAFWKHWEDKVNLRILRNRA